MANFRIAHPAVWSSVGLAIQHDRVFEILQQIDADPGPQANAEGVGPAGPQDRGGQESEAWREMSSRGDFFPCDSHRTVIEALDCPAERRSSTSGGLAAPAKRVR